MATIFLTMKLLHAMIQYLYQIFDVYSTVMRIRIMANDILKWVGLRYNPKKGFKRFLPSMMPHKRKAIKKTVIFMLAACIVWHFMAIRLVRTQTKDRILNLSDICKLVLKCYISKWNILSLTYIQNNLLIISQRAAPAITPLILSGHHVLCCSAHTLLRSVPPILI